MSDSLSFPYSSKSSDEDSPFAAFDRMIASMKPAIATRNSPTPAIPLSNINPNALNSGRAERASDTRASMYPKLAEKDRELAAMKREMQDLMASRRQLEKALSARDSKIANLEKSSEATARKHTEVAMQLKMTRAELDRTRHRALTGHRQQEQRIAALEQTIARKMGLSRPGACVQHELLVNPLTGKPTGTVNCSPSCLVVLDASINAQHNVDAKISGSLRLESLCELLERAFEMGEGAVVPHNVVQRLEVAVESAVELLDVLVQRFEDLEYAKTEYAPVEDEPLHEAEYGAYDGIPTERSAEGSMNELFLGP